MRRGIRYIIMSLIVLLLCVNCTLSKSKWIWVRNAMNPPDETQNADASLIGTKNFSAHSYAKTDFQRHLDAVSGSYLSAGNELRLLPNNESSRKRLEMIKSARSSIFISTFEVLCDDAGFEFLDALATSVKRGVDVRLLIDGNAFWAFYAGYCPEKYVKAGIQVERSPYAFLDLGNSMRLHDKLFIVDTKEAITGGQNIGRFWADSTGTDENFRDTDIWVRGPVVNDIARRFIQQWKTVQPHDTALAKFEQLLLDRTKEFTTKGLVGIDNYKTWLAKAEPMGLCRFVAQDPLIGTYYVNQTYATLAKAAQERVVFHVPSLNGRGTKEQEELLSALVDAANRNVRVDVITNGPGLMRARMIPSMFGWVFAFFTLGQAYESVKNTMLNVYVYKRWIHSKVFNFDGVAVAVGSFNFDESLNHWMEDTLICMDKDLSQSTSSMFAKDFSNSYLLPRAIEN